MGAPRAARAFAVCALLAGACGVLFADDARAHDFFDRLMRGDEPMSDFPGTGWDQFAPIIGGLSLMALGLGALVIGGPAGIALGAVATAGNVALSYSRGGWEQVFVDLSPFDDFYEAVWKPDLTAGERLGRLMEGALQTVALAAGAQATAQGLQGLSQAARGARAVTQTTDRALDVSRQATRARGIAPPSGLPRPPALPGPSPAGPFPPNRKTLAFQRRQDRQQLRRESYLEHDLLQSQPGPLTPATRQAIRDYANRIATQARHDAQKARWDIRHKPREDRLSEYLFSREGHEQYEEALRRVGADPKLRAELGRQGLGPVRARPVGTFAYQLDPSGCAPACLSHHLRTRGLDVSPLQVQERALANDLWMKGRLGGMYPEDEARLIKSYGLDARHYQGDQYRTFQLVDDLQRGHGVNVTINNGSPAQPNYHRVALSDLRQTPNGPTLVVGDPHSGTTWEVRLRDFVNQLDPRDVVVIR